MEQLLLQQIKNELVNGNVKKGHPFKYFTFGTCSGNLPMLRTVVLRKFYADFSLVFYTDRRSRKIDEIKNNNAVSALFYHPKKLLQLQLIGTAKLITEPKVLAEIWKSIPEPSKKDYTTSSAPGTIITNPDEVEYLDRDNHFCMVELRTSRIEYLRLKRPNHLRAEFTKTADDWKGTFLVP